MSSRILLVEAAERLGDLGDSRQALIAHALEQRIDRSFLTGTEFIEAEDALQDLVLGIGHPANRLARRDVRTNSPGTG